MGLLNFFRQEDIDHLVEECKSVPGAVLIDVRTPAEYRDGHIPGSKNIPLQSIGNISSIISDRDTPLYVYCHSGVRSRQAAGLLRRMGYTDVTDLGGICNYRGKCLR